MRSKEPRTSACVHRAMVATADALTPRATAMPARTKWSSAKRDTDFSQTMMCGLNSMIRLASFRRYPLSCCTRGSRDTY